MLFRDNIKSIHWTTHRVIDIESIHKAMESIHRTIHRAVESIHTAICIKHLSSICSLPVLKTSFHAHIRFLIANGMGVYGGTKVQEKLSEQRC